MAKSPLGVSLLLPGYNEEANIEGVVARCAHALEGLVARWEIIVIDDGSVDQTPALADRIAAASGGRIRVVHNPINLGVGQSLLIGMRAATHELVLHNAMDYPFDLADLERLLPLFPEHDVVIVARSNRSAHTTWRKLTSLVHYWLVRILFGVPFRDMNFVQIYKRETLARLGVRARSPAFVTPETLIRARDGGMRIAEVTAPFHRRERGQAHYGKPRDILWTLSDMLSFWLERLPARRRLRATGEVRPADR